MRFSTSLATFAFAFLGVLLVSPRSQAAPRLYFVPDKHALFDGVALSDGTKTLSPNFLGRYQDIREWVASNPQALAFAEQHMAASERATLFAVVNFVATSGGLVAGIAMNNGTILWSTLAVHIALAVVMATQTSAARTALLNAINTFNGVKVDLAETVLDHNQHEFQTRLSYQFRL